MTSSDALSPLRPGTPIRKIWPLEPNRKNLFKVIAYYCFMNDEGQWKETYSSMIVEAKGIEEAALSGFELGERARESHIRCVKVYRLNIECFPWEWKCDRGESLAAVKARLKDEIKSRKGRKS
jgi:hypothetical protein